MILLVSEHFSQSKILGFGVLLGKGPRVKKKGLFKVNEQLQSPLIRQWFECKNTYISLVLLS